MKQFMSKSHKIVCELKIIAIKSIKKVKRIQFSGSPKAKSIQYTVDSFEILGLTTSMARQSVTLNLQIQTLQLHISCSLLFLRKISLQWQHLIINSDGPN